MKKYLVSGAICFFALLFTACQEDPNSAEIISDPADDLRYVINSGISQNPYDSVGIVHNLGLEYFANNQDLNSFPQDSSGRDSVLFYQLNNFIVANPNLLNGTFPAGAGLQTMVSASFSILDSNNTSMSTMISNLQISTTAKSYVEDILESFQCVFDNPSFYSTSDNCQNVINAIVSIENAVINNALLSSDDKKQVLYISSVARHSYSYWVTEYIDDSATTVWAPMLPSERELGLSGAGNGEVAFIGDLISAIASVVAAISPDPTVKAACIAISDIGGAIAQLEENDNSSLGQCAGRAIAYSALTGAAATYGPGL